MTKRSLARTLGTGTVLIALALTAGCSQIQQIATSITGGGDETLAMLSAPAGEPLWSIDVQPAGSDGPLIIEDTVVSYVVEEGELKLAGFDLTTGEKKWILDAVTGASTHLPIEVFTGENGTPYVVKRSVPVLDEQTNFWHHPFAVIEATTGLANATSALEWWTAPAITDCVSSTIACMMGTQSGSSIQIIGIDENGEFTANPNSLLLSQLQHTHDSRNGDNFIVGAAVDNTNIAVFVQDGEAVWDIPLTEFGLPETLTRNENSIYWSDANVVAQTFPEQNVVLVDATYRDLSSAVVVQQATVTALDMSSGEVLWTTAGELCLHGVVCEGENSFTQGADGSWNYNVGDFNLVGFDLRTGERTWEAALEGMTMYQKESWNVAGDKYAVLAVESSNKLINLQSGEILDIADDHRFGCPAEGSEFTHHRSSRPDLPLVQDTNNVVSQSCGVSGADDDITSFTQNVVASRANQPFTAGDEWSVFDKQIRVIATNGGIHAYEF